MTINLICPKTKIKLASAPFYFPYFVQILLKILGIFNKIFILITGILEQITKNVQNFLEFNGITVPNVGLGLAFAIGGIHPLNVIPIEKNASDF
jgi:maleate cis-trans isomerase